MSQNKIKILLGPSSFAAQDKAPLKLLLDAGLEIIDNPFKRKLTKTETIDLLKNDIQGLIAGLETLDKEVIDKSNLKVISRCGSGMSNVDQEAAKQKGIQVFSTPDGPTNAVAELTIGALLSLLRHLGPANNDLHAKKWTKLIGGEIRGKILALIGFGRIGRRVATLAQAFGAKIIVVDPAYQGDFSQAEHKSLEEALAIADIISLHSSGTNLILGPKELAQTKKGCILLNAARGELVDEQAICELIDAKHIAAVWMDTFTQEPYQGPLCGKKEALLTPHIGSYTAECRLSMEMECARNLLKGLK